MPKSDGQYHKRPDIYVLDKKNKIDLLFDMTIVADHNINGAYWKKRNMYKELKNRLMKIEKLKDVRIIPVDNSNFDDNIYVPTIVPLSIFKLIISMDYLICIKPFCVCYFLHNID
ncbi:hypothetical protein ENUP19_0214G0006 [Entamoeba nuttalli]|uniref:Uncharacterized protein n=1 Tax=Entamoeba nuttalli TaxID=412467 RepID=A0ABQ0DP96_9EUKA